MSDIQLAADGLQNLANLYRSVLQAADALKGVGDLESYTSECQGRADAAAKAATDAESKLADISAVLGDAQQQLAVLEQAKKDTVSSAQQQVSDVLIKAQQDALELVTEAKEEADKVRTQAASDVMNANARLLDLAVQTDMSQKKYDALLTKLSELKASLG